MTLEYEYSKTKLPKKSDYAYPFKKSDIDKSLDKAGVSDLKDVYFSTGRRTDFTEGYPIAVAVLAGESRSGYWSKSSPLIGIYAVPKKHLDRIRTLIDKHEILHKVMLWIASLETATNVIRDVTRKRAVIYLEDKLIILDENQKQVRLP